MARYSLEEQAEAWYSMCPPSNMAASSSPVKTMMTAKTKKKRERWKKKKKRSKLQKCKENWGMGIYYIRKMNEDKWAEMIMRGLRRAKPALPPLFTWQRPRCPFNVEPNREHVRLCWGQPSEGLDPTLRKSENVAVGNGVVLLKYDNKGMKEDAEC